MLLKDFTPAYDVQEFVQLYRIVHLQFLHNEPVPFKAYPPRPEQCLAFYPYDTETVSYTSSSKIIKNIPAVLYGQFTEVTNRNIGRNFLVFQIIFKPGALYRLTAIPAATLNNEYIDAGAVFKGEIKFINEQLAAATDYNAMVQIANQFMRHLIKTQRKDKLLIDDVCTTMLQSDGNLNLKKLAYNACLSTKQLERKFKERTGVNPKLFERIIRFDKAFRLKNSRPNLDWLRIAMECNYHDYQHLAKEYKDFTGLSPVGFHEIEEKAPERQFGLSEGYYK
jgi:AraC-like DNA-binding protein